MLKLVRISDIDAQFSRDETLIPMIQDFACELIVTTEISPEGVRALSSGFPLFVSPTHSKGRSNTRYRLVRGTFMYYLSVAVSTDSEVWCHILSTSETRKLPDEKQFLIALFGLLGMQSKATSYQSLVRIYKYFDSQELKKIFPHVNNLSTLARHCGRTPNSLYTIPQPPESKVIIRYAHQSSRPNEKAK